MDERQLIKKIEQLKEIKPNPAWVLLTKKEILGESEKFDFSFLFTPIRKPALVFAFRGVIVAVVLLAGGFFYLYFLSSQSPKISFSDLGIFETQENEKLTASLEEIQLSLKKITSSLDNLKEARGKREALAMTGVVKETALRGKEVVEQIKPQSPTKNVLASLGEISQTLEELGRTSSDLQKEMLEKAFEDLKQRGLTEEDRTRLERAKDYYQQGKESEALILIMRIMETS